MCNILMKIALWSIPSKSDMGCWADFPGTTFLVFYVLRYVERWIGGVRGRQMGNLLRVGPDLKSYFVFYLLHDLYETFGNTRAF